MLANYVYRFRALPLLTVSSLEIQDIDHQDAGISPTSSMCVLLCIAYMSVTYTSLIIVSQALSSCGRAPDSEVRSVAAWQSASGGPHSRLRSEDGRASLDCHSQWSHTADVKHSDPNIQYSRLILRPYVAGRALTFTRALQGAIVWGGRRYAALWFVAVTE